MVPDPSDCSHSAARAQGGARKGPQLSSSSSPTPRIAEGLPNILIGVYMETQLRGHPGLPGALVQGVDDNTPGLCSAQPLTRVADCMSPQSGLMGLFCHRLGLVTSFRGLAISFVKRLETCHENQCEPKWLRKVFGGRGFEMHRKHGDLQRIKEVFNMHLFIQCLQMFSMCWI